jgi:glycosyltransferase involved in cell wall biosynthesis
MRIIILNWRDIKNPKSGGAEIATMEHAKAWIKKGYDVIWFTSGFKNCKKTEIIDGIKVVRRGNFLTVYLLAPFYYLRNRKNIDLVIDQIHGLPFFTPLYVRKPKVVLIHEVAGPIWDYMFPFPVNVIGKIIEPYYFRLYKKERFWVPSESTLKDLVELGIERTHIKLIYCGISNKTLESLPKKEAVPTFLFVSRVVKMKGIEEVLKAFLLILNELGDARLWIVGDGDKKYINRIIQSLDKYSITDRVKFYGKVSEKEKLEIMKRAHLMLHASVKEGWGLVVIESASQGTPSIVYDVGGLRDSVKNNATGIVLDKNTPFMMAKEAVKLVKDRKRFEILQKNCLSWAKELTWDKSTSQSTELIESLARNH